MQSAGARLTFWAILPLALLAFVLVAAMIIAPCVRRDARSDAGAGTQTTFLRWALPTILRLSFLLYPTVTQAAFQAFPCYDLGVDGGRWLIVDVDIACGGEAHRRVRLVAWVMVGAYPLGLLAIYFVLLLLARTSGSATRKEDRG